MTMRKIITMSVLGSALVLGACDKGDGGKKGGDKQAKAAEAGAAEAGAAEAGAAEAGAVEAEAEDGAADLDPKVEKAVTLANQISATPENADTILADAGMDREGFEQLLYEIAKDPELSKSYAVARDA